MNYIQKICIFFCTIFIMVQMGLDDKSYGAVNIKVTVEGVEGNIRKNVLAYLTIEQKKADPNLTEMHIKKMNKKAPDEIKKALQPFGNYKPSIQAELNKEDSVWHARYTIDPGDPVIIKEIDFRITGAGADDEGFQILIKKFPIHEGEVLEHERYEKAKKALQELALEQGYLDANMIKHQIQVYPEKNSAVILLHFDAGPRFKFGNIIFKQDILNPKFLARFVTFKKGDSYTLRQLLDLQNALTESEYFSKVDVHPLRDRAENLEVPIEVVLVPHKRNRYKLGIGFGTDTGVRGLLGWENLRINRQGHRFIAEAKLSQIKNNITASYRIPIGNPRTDQLSFNAGFLQEDTDTIDSKTFLVGIGRDIARRGWRETLSLSYQVEDFTIDGDSGSSNLLLPGASWSRIWADDRLYTTRGVSLILDIRGTHKALLSDASFLQGRLNGKLFHGLWKGGRVILRGDVGSTLVDEITDLPASIRFFAGGDKSVRGYDFKELGTTDEGGNVIGGKHLLVGSIEFEQRVYKLWSVAMFYDTGNAINIFSDSLKEGAGIGVRWLSPVGPIRLDIAFALSKPGKPLRLHFNIGPDL